MIEIVPMEKITIKIYLIRKIRLMLDHDLAGLYEVTTKALKQAVKRNLDRFPSDFMFKLTKSEFADLRSQIVTSSSQQWGGLRYRPMAFTEQGIAMLSSVLRSKSAVQVNIEIMRIFVKIRDVLASDRNLAIKLKELESRIKDHDEKIEIIFEAILQLLIPPEESKNPIGFEIKEPKAGYGKK